MDGAPTGDGEPMFRLRSYQQEMLNESLKKNVIIAMDTGSGKTHIAVARILAELERSPEGQLAWFISPSVALCKQQYVVLCENLPASHIRTLLGDDGVERWTDQRLWDAVLLSVDVVVSTPAVLADALTHGFVKMSRLSLCVFDEAHRCTKNHPMNSIMKNFYWPSKLKGSSVPHILALTASPVINSKQDSLATIEGNLDALTITPKIHRPELEKYVQSPAVVNVLFLKAEPDEIAAPDTLSGALARAVRTYNLAQDPYVIQLRGRGDRRAQKELEKVITERKTYCRGQLCSLDLRAASLENELGSWISIWYIASCILRFKDGLATGFSMLPDLSELEKQHLLGIFGGIERQAQAPQLLAGRSPRMSDKATRLIEMLRKEASPRFRGIVFVEQRVMVTALAHLLQQIPDIAKRFKIGCFVGTSTSSNRKASIADLVELKQQQHDLDDFREGRKNLMIATNVLEEGIDVSACNYVFCFEPPKNLVSFVQRRGRARQAQSKYVLFQEQGDLKAMKNWQALEADMKQTYMDDSREMAQNPIDDAAADARLYRVSSTGALLTMENAVSHLYHFAAVSTLQSSNYVDLRPEFDTNKVMNKAGEDEWTASVTLPSFVHPDVRRAETSQVWHSEPTAIKDAAFEAYVALHKAGLLNDNLLPLVKDDGPEAGQQHVDQPSIVEVAERQSSWMQMYANFHSAVDWHSSLVTLTLDGSVVVQMTAWSPTKELPNQAFGLHWNESQTYRLNITPDGRPALPLDADDLALLRECTHAILSSVHANRMTAAANDFPVLFSPTDIKNLPQWLLDVTASQSAASLIAGIEEDGCGLVRVKGQVGRAFFFSELVADGSELVVTNLPKRRDFLHRVSTEGRNAAHTSKQSIPAADCVFDKLPAKYALFGLFVPSIMHRIDTSLLAQTLHEIVLRTVGISNTSLVLEAISAPAAAEIADYNRLEYLGDSILKHCAELQVVAQHTTWPESYLTMARDRIVRNSNLARVAMVAGLDEYILNKSFTGMKWRPIYMSEILAQAPARRQMSSKILADVVEALLGAAYVDGGLEKGLQCMRVLLPTETWLSPEQCFRTLIRELRPCQFTNVAQIERLVGHHFTHPTLLVEAITHVSFPDNETGLSYERLEFLGDSVLDMLIIPKLFAHPRKLRHWEMHRAHEALVNSHFLGFCCLGYTIDVEQNSIVPTDERGKRLGISHSSRQVYLRDIFRTGSELLPFRRATIAAFETQHAAIDLSLRHSKMYPWPALFTLNPHKIFCDLVESLLGALYLDTRGDLGVCEAFARRLGILDHMQRMLDACVETITPKARLGDLADVDDVRYVTSHREDDAKKRVWACRVEIAGKEVASVQGCGRRDEAEVLAAARAAEVVEGRLGAEGRRKKRKFEVAVRGDANAEGDVEGGADVIMEEAD